ncbi:MAG TPA: glycosyltransferase family 2 protein [Lachnospiraceae bacterium]|nr:glycosyltransferase family 2 protein [Lachnospiraceae bacterium]
MKAKVSVIIPNYNGEAYLNQCLDSLLQQDVRSFEIIIVDDASTDHSIEEAKKKYPENDAFPQTKYLMHESNQGFCKSVNDGIKMASSPYVILLNNDTVVDAAFVRELYQAIHCSEKIFSVGAKMVSLKDPDIMDDGGDYYCSLGWAFAPAKDRPAINYMKKARIFASCGGAAIYRKKLLEELGMFDENHFAYLEDIDIGYRARLMGYVNVFAPQALVYHAGSAASGSRYNDFKARLSARNSIYLIYKNMPIWQIVLNMPHLIIGFMLKIVFYILKHMGHTYLSGIKEGIELCRTEEGRKHRMDFKRVGLGRLLILEAELLTNTVRRVIG